MFSSVICGLIILHRCVLSHSTNTSSDELLNISSTTLDSNSRYKAQMDFIRNYLLHSKQSENLTKIRDKENITASTDKRQEERCKKKSDNISTNLLPVIYSYRGETHPTHPRIPRKTPRKRTRLGKQQRRRRNKHGARVFLLKPARYLLPPLVTHRIEDIPGLSYTTSTENDSRDSRFKENISFEDSHSNSTFSRRAFIPPPLRYLLPPFYEENEISQVSTENNPTSEKDIEETSNTDEQYRSQLENTFRAVESAQNVDVKPQLEPTTQTETLQNGRDRYTTEDYIFRQSEDFTIQEEEKGFTVGRYSTENSNLDNYPNNTVQREDINTNSNKFMINVESKRISGVDSSVTRAEEATTQFPVITGRNIEKELFESGLFQDLETTLEPTTESVHKEAGDNLSMYNRPLLSEEVAKAGMKIVVTDGSSTPVKKWDDARRSSRGRYKFKHFNQYQFDGRKQTRPEQGSGRSLKLSVAETNYYNNRRASKQQQYEEREVQVIPGVPGKDYPTLTKPPTTRNFSCKNLAGGRGYYGDTSTGCQVFYVCVGDGAGEPMLCPNGTLFSQDFLVCDWWYNVDCRENV